jgi:integrase
MREAADAVGLKHIGTHTMRKTFGYWHYQKCKDLALLCKILGHSDVSITARYIGLDQDTMDSSMRNFTI